MSNHSCSSCLSVRARNRDDRNPTTGTVRVQHIHNRATDIASLAVGREVMHADPRSSIHLNDAAARGIEGLGYVLQDKVDAAHVETDSASSALSHPANRGVDFIRDIAGGAARRQV